MKDLQIFTYNDTPIRTFEQDGELWWLLKDICGILGIEKSRNVASRLDQDEKGAFLTGTPSGEQKMIYVNEPGLYNVILRSDKPDAKNFKRWITHEVLPSVRKTGAYNVAPKMSQAQLLLEAVQQMVDMEQRIDMVETSTAQLEVKVDKAMQVFSKPAEDHWKADIDKAIKTLCASVPLSITATKGRMYAELESKAGCNINRRLSQLKKRKQKAGARYKDIMELTKLDAIAADKTLRAIFEGVVRGWQARYSEAVTL